MAMSPIVLSQPAMGLIICVV